MQRGLRDKSKRGSTTAQADNFAGAKLGKKRRLAPLGGCDFFVFRPKVTLKTISLEAKKSPFCNLVTSSRNDRSGRAAGWDGAETGRKKLQSQRLHPLRGAKDAAPRLGQVIELRRNED